MSAAFHVKGSLISNSNGQGIERACIHIFKREGGIIYTD